MVLFSLKFSVNASFYMLFKTRFVKACIRIASSKCLAIFFADIFFKKRTDLSNSKVGGVRLSFRTSLFTHFLCINLAQNLCYLEIIAFICFLENSRIPI